MKGVYTIFELDFAEFVSHQDYYYDREPEKITVILQPPHTLQNRQIAGIQAGRFQPWFPKSCIALARQIKPTKKDPQRRFRYYCEDRGVQNILELDYHRQNNKMKWRDVVLATKK